MMTITRNLGGLVLSAVLAIAAAGCAAPNAATEIKAFSDATIQTSDNITEAFNLVEQNRYKEEVSVSIVNYDSEHGFHPNDIQPFISTNALQARLDILDGLKAYAANLSTLMGNNVPTNFDSDTTKLGQQLTKIDTDLVSDSFFKKQPVTAQELQIFTTAINALGHWLIEYKQNKAAKGAISSMQQPVADICQLLQKDLEILGRQSANDSANTLRNENQYILNYLHAFDESPGQKRAEIQEMADLTRTMRSEATLFESMQSSVAKMATAHKALGQVFSKNTKDVSSLISEFSAESSRISKYYNSLKTQ
jgi:hypothetical protein